MSADYVVWPPFHRLPPEIIDLEVLGLRFSSRLLKTIKDQAHQPEWEYARFPKEQPSTCPRALF